MNIDYLEIARKVGLLEGKVSEHRIVMFGDAVAKAVAEDRRIAACLKVCNGVPTDLLEKSRSLEGFMQTLLKIEQERDEARALCKKVNGESEYRIDADSPQPTTNLQPF